MSFWYQKMSKNYVITARREWRVAFHHNIQDKVAMKHLWGDAPAPKSQCHATVVSQQSQPRDNSDNQQVCALPAQVLFKGLQGENCARTSATALPEIASLVFTVPSQQIQPQSNFIAVYSHTKPWAFTMRLKRQNTHWTQNVCPHRFRKPGCGRKTVVWIHGRWWQGMPSMLRF